MSQVGKFIQLSAPLQTLTGDVGGPVGPDGLGNINVLGDPDIDITGTPGTNTLQLTNLTKLSPYIVGVDAAQSRFTSIQAAIDQAVTDGASQATPKIVYVTPGNYSQDVALEPWVSVEGVTAGNYIRNVAISGHMTGPTTAGNLSLAGISITSPDATAGLILGGAAANTIEFSECDIFSDNATGVEMTNDLSTVIFDDCRFSSDIAQMYFDITDATVDFLTCRFQGATTTTSILTGTSTTLFLSASQAQLSVAMTGTAIVAAHNISMNGTALACFILAPGAFLIVTDSVFTSATGTGFFIDGTGGTILYSSITPVFSIATKVNPVIAQLQSPLFMGNISFDGGTTTMAADGQLIIGDTGASPKIATLTGGDATAIVNGAGTITINTTGGGYEWNEETGTTVGLLISNGYIMNNAGLVTGTLPAVAALGDAVRVTGKGAGGWLIAQNAGQTIHFGGLSTTTGAGGSLASTNLRDSVELVCVTANTDWNVLSSIGSITVV